jgi:hypothetical protein
MQVISVLSTAPRGQLLEWPKTKPNSGYRRVHWQHERLATHFPSAGTSYVAILRMFQLTFVHYGGDWIVVCNAAGMKEEIV